MPKKIQPGDIVAYPQQYITGPVRDSQLFTVEEKAKMFTSTGVRCEPVYCLTNVQKRHVDKTANGGDIAHVCTHCRMLKKDHAKDGKCLYEPTYWKRLTVKGLK